MLDRHLRAGAEYAADSVTLKEEDDIEDNLMSNIQDIKGVILNTFEGFYVTKPPFQICWNIVCWWNKIGMYLIIM